MLGWCADFFRLWWGLIYWNVRKTWFQARRGRSPCPCQSLSDSGRAFETQCEACTPWSKPARFRRVCPLLVPTPAGLRCSANTAEVRPFWGRTAGYYGGAFLGIYGACVIGVFIFLRTVGYPVNIVHVALPPMWHRITELRGWFFLDRANQAFAQGRASEGLLYLTNAYEFDPQNYVAGLTLAKHLQVQQPAQSDRVFNQLMQEHPEKRHVTAQEWFRALLARGSFQQVTDLAREELLANAPQAPVWMRALLFATRQSGKDGPLRELAANPSPAVRPWRQLLATELLLRAGLAREVRTALEQPWPPPGPDPTTRFLLFYRVEALLRLRAPLDALDLLLKFPGGLDDEAVVTLKLEAYALMKADRPMQAQVTELLAPRLTLANLSIVKILCAQLIRYPDTAVFEQLWQKVERDRLPLNTETAGAWFSLLCTAGVLGDKAHLHELTADLKSASKTPFTALSLVEAFFRGDTAERRMNALLPILPLPIEVTYALIERYSPNRKSV